TTRGPAGGRIASLLRLLVLVAAALVVLLAAAKLAIRKWRYLTRDPRKLARACVRELSDFVDDQGAKAPASATLGELAQLVEAELGVSASAFVSAGGQGRVGDGGGGGEGGRAGAVRAGWGRGRGCPLRTARAQVAAPRSAQGTVAH